MPATDSSTSRPQRRPAARSPSPAAVFAAEARAAEETVAELDELIATEIEAPLRPVASKLAPLLEHQLRRRAHEDVALRSPRALAADLEGWTEERLRTLFTTMGTGTAATLDDAVLEIERAHRDRLEATLARFGPQATPLVAAAREVPLHPLGALGALDGGPARWSGRGTLALRASLPGPLGRRLVRAGARAHLRSALGRQAARLRAELALHARAAVADYRHELRARLEDVAR